MEWENHTILVEFFLKGLSDICYTTTSIPSTLVSLLSERKTISLFGCAGQMFLGLAMGTTECVLLDMTAFDRYVAICNPLRYPMIMSKDAYVSMAAGSWIIGAVNSAVQIVFVVQLPFCRNNIINHFTCEILAVMKLACADISGNEFIMLMATTLFIRTPLLLIIVSYALIFVSSKLALLREQANPSLKRHLIQTTWKLSMFCGVMTPMLNPLIYSLRNKDVKKAVKHLLNRRFFSK
uniref:Olfactory receptor n=1 Tax=Colobus angolensis palliatus TaxID=336983 RepID=A0A2K5KFY6_COLAP